ncbi:MAG: acetyl-CoA synthetase [Clostridiales bacterium]|nr:acetyl-CoA synthetase [Clostridiales bacterium]
MSIYQKFCVETFDDNGVIKDFKLQYPENYNFGYDVVDYIAEQEPDRTAMVWCNTEGQEKIFTFKELSILSNRTANAFMAQGMKKGDRVMVILKRHYEYWYVTLALHKIGAVLIPSTHMLTSEDIEYRIQDASIKYVICTPQENAPQKLLPLKDRCESLHTMWTVQESVEGFRNLTEDIAASSSTLERQDTLAAEPMIMYFTSGTTGYPKGVIHDHTYSLAHIITAKYWQQAFDGGLHFTIAETGWGKTSWGKIYGQWLVGSAVMVFDFDNFDPKAIVTIINRYKVTTFCAPPTVYRYLVKKGMSTMPSLVHACTAGEALNPEVFNRFSEVAGLSLMEGYGQTESTLILANWAGTTSRPGSMGTPSPLYHVEILKEDGTFGQAGELGEIVIVPREDGDHTGIFMDYNDNPSLYKYAWRGGVYHTGDMAWKDEDNYYWFSGRIDDVIKTGGFRVGPFEIENVLMEHPAVMECSVIGIPDTLRGQAIKAIIVLAPGFEASNTLKKEIQEFCNTHVAEYKWVRHIEFVDVMPKTISGKILKREQRGENS